MKRLIVGQLLNNSLAQTTIEFTLAVVVLFIFFVGALRAFTWTNKTLVERQENYEATRTAAGDNEVMRSQWIPLEGLTIDEKTDFVPEKNILKNYVVNNFYNETSVIPGTASKLVGIVMPDKHIHNYEPLKIFKEEE
jgi:hypothetical protein